MEPFAMTQNGKAVFCMCEDLYITGNIIYGDTLPPIALKSTDGRSHQLIAGNESDRGYVEGVGQSANFGAIYSCLHLSKTSLLVVDFSNHCLRLINRLSQQTMPFIGNCTKRGFRDGIEPLFKGPWKVILDLMNNDQLLLLDKYNHALRAINMLNMSASTLAVFNTSLQQNSIAQHTNGNVYVFESSTIIEYDYVTRSITLVAGSGHGTGELRDGPLLESQFATVWTVDMIFLTSNYMLVTDMRNQRLRLVDFGWNMVFSICIDGGRLYGRRNLTRCRVHNPRALLTVNNTLFIGLNEGIDSIQGSLKFEFLRSPSTT